MISRYKHLSSLLFTAIAALLLAPAAAVAQPAETPVDVARRYFETVRRNDWQAGAALMHPDELARFKELFVTLLASGKKGEDVVKELMELESASDLLNLSGSQVFERFLRTFMGRSPEMAEMMASMRVSIIGSVPEGQDTAHILYRTEMDAAEMPDREINVVSMKRMENSWRMMLEPQMEGAAEMIVAMVNMEEESSDEETYEYDEYEEVPSEEPPPPYEEETSTDEEE